MPGGGEEASLTLNRPPHLSPGPLPGPGRQALWWQGCLRGVSLQVLDVLCSLCLCNGVAVRANQNLICDNLLPRRNLLLQTRLINDVTR